MQIREEANITYCEKHFPFIRRARDDQADFFALGSPMNCFWTTSFRAADRHPYAHDLGTQQVPIFGARSARRSSSGILSEVRMIC
jgi:hypothetical protein